LLGLDVSSISEIFAENTKINSKLVESFLKHNVVLGAV
jgi:hypothetical protein